MACDACSNSLMAWLMALGSSLLATCLTFSIARRIVGWAKIDDQLRKGERFGMIRFGSRTEVYLPLSASVLVKAGDRVIGGLTVIARLTAEQ